MAFGLILGVLFFAKFVELLKRSTVRGGTRIFQAKDMLNLCFSFSKSQSIYVYKHYAYKKECTYIPRKRKPFW